MRTTGHPGGLGRVSMSTLWVPLASWAGACLTFLHLNGQITVGTVEIDGAQRGDVGTVFFFTHYFLGEVLVAEIGSGLRWVHPREEGHSHVVVPVPHQPAA